MARDVQARDGGVERSMAQTLVEFAQPLLVELDEQTSQEQLLELMQLVVTIWNALVVDQWDKGTSHLAELEAVVSEAGAPPELASLFEQLVRRKQELFADDLRAVGDFDVVLDGKGSFTVSAEGRLPKSLEPPPP